MRVSKYTALARHLAELQVQTVTLSFAQIEEIIDDDLPLSAYEHRPWWANETAGTHIWAHLWQAAGWRHESVDFQRQLATFKRTNANTGSILASLAPKSKKTIYDLLNEVGVPTDEWHEKANGDQAGAIKSNGRFCYNWTFGSAYDQIVLCLWYDDLEMVGEKIITSDNMRALAKKLRETSRDTRNDDTIRRRALAQFSRAEAFDNAVNLSHSRGLPITVIIARGNRRDREQDGEGSSHVRYRSLDQIQWYAHSYNEGTGEFVLVRGVKRIDIVDEIAESMDESPQKLDAYGTIRLRRGQKEFRDKLLAAYGRKCAVTRCRIEGLLEAAHIQPYSVARNNDVSNGLLLRADIHTLFDLNLLFIDSRLTVRLAPEILESDYKRYDGLPIAEPSRPSEVPNRDALLERFSKFQKKPVGKMA